MALSGVSLLISSVASAFGEAVLATVSFIKTVVTTVASIISNVFLAGLTNIAVLIVLLILIGFSIPWLPYHHNFLEMGERVYRCVPYELNRVVALPIAEAVEPMYNTLIPWWNFIGLLPSKFKMDLIMLPLRCKNTTNLIRTTLKTTAPVIKALSLVITMVSKAIVGNTTDIEVPILVTGTLGDSVANISAATSGVAACYCDFLSYPFDIVTLVFADDHLQCAAGNFIGFLQEAAATLFTSFYRLLRWILDVLTWIVRIIEEFIKFLYSLFGKKFGRLASVAEDIVTRTTGNKRMNGISRKAAEYIEDVLDPDDGSSTTETGKASAGNIRRKRTTHRNVRDTEEEEKHSYGVRFNFSIPFPPFHARYLLPNITGAVLRYEAGMCCFGDSFTDVLNSIMGLVIDALNSTVLPGTGKIGFYRFPKDVGYGSVFKAIPQAIARTVQLVWHLLIDLLEGADDFTDLTKSGGDIDMMFDSYEGSCVEITNGAYTAGVFFNRLLLISSVQLGVPVSLFTAATATGIGTLVGSPVAPFILVPLVPINMFNLLMGVKAANHSCRSVVHFLRAIVKIGMEVRSYSDYKKGGYLNCTINALQQMGQGVEDETNAMFDIIPKGGCSATGCENHTICIPDVTCTDFVFHGEVGRMAATPARVAAAFIDYTVKISESASSFGAVRSLTTDCIFDEMIRGINASTAMTQALIDLIPFGAKFSIPGVAGNISLDDFLLYRTIPGVVNSTGIFAIEIFRFIMRTIHTGDFNKWKFDPRYLDHLLVAEMAVANNTATMMTSLLCALRNSLDLENTSESACPFRVDVSAINFTLCPLDLVPCPYGTAAAMLRAMFRISNLIPKLLLYTTTALPDVLFDDILCEFETASAELANATKGWDIQMDIPYWGTHLGLNISMISSTLPYAITKVMTMVNRLVVEIIHLARHKAIILYEACPDPKLPYYDFVNDKCYACNDPVVTAYDADPCGRANNGTDIYHCCPDGTCSLRCFDGNIVHDDAYAALGAFLSFSEATSAPFGFIEPRISKVYNNTMSIPIQVIRTLFEIAFAELPGWKSKGYANAMETVGCTQELVWKVAGGVLTVVPSVLGRVFHLITTLAGAQKLGDDGLRNLQRLGDSMGFGVETFGSITTELSNVVLVAIGQGIDAGKSGGSTDAAGWFKLVTEELCKMQNALENIPVAVRGFVMAIDITGSNITCEIADFASAVTNIPVQFAVQGINLIAFLGGSETASTAGFDYHSVFTSMRNVSITFGNLGSAIIYYPISLFLLGEPGVLADLRGVMDSLGSVVGLIINLVISLLESIVEGVIQIMYTATKPIFGTSLFPFCGFSNDTYDIFIPFLKSVNALLLGMAGVLDNISKSLGDVLRTLSMIFTKLVIDKTGPFRILISGLLNLIFAFVGAIFSIFSGNGATIGAAFQNFANAFINFFISIWEAIRAFFIGFLDGIVFKNVWIGDYHPVECLINFVRCVKGIIKRIFRDEIPSPDANGAASLSSHLLYIAFMFPSSDSCQATFINAAYKYYNTIHDSINETDYSNYNGTSTSAKNSSSSESSMEEDIYYNILNNTMPLSLYDRGMLTWCVMRLYKRGYMDAFLGTEEREQKIRDTTKLQRNFTEIINNAKQTYATMTSRNTGARTGASTGSNTGRNTLKRDDIPDVPHSASDDMCYGDTFDVVCIDSISNDMTATLGIMLNASVVAMLQGTGVDGATKIIIAEMLKNGNSPEMAEYMASLYHEHAGSARDASSTILDNFVKSNFGGWEPLYEVSSYMRILSESVTVASNDLAKRARDLGQQKPLTKEQKAKSYLASLIHDGWYTTDEIKNTMDTYIKSLFGTTARRNTLTTTKQPMTLGDDIISFDNVKKERNFAPKWIKSGDAFCKHNIDAWKDYDLSDVTVLCSESCPNCTSPLIYYNVVTPCPLDACPDLAADHPEYRQVCSRICSSGYESTMFELFCAARYYIGTGSANVTEEFAIVFDNLKTTETEFVLGENLYGAVCGSDDPFAACPDRLTMADVNLVIGYGRGNTSSGPYVEICNDMSRYGMPDPYFCYGICSVGNPTSLYNSYNDGLVPTLSIYGYRFLLGICSNFCIPYSDTGECLSKTAPDLQCSGDAATGQVCLQTCDNIQWDTTTTTMPKDSCSPVTQSCDKFIPGANKDYGCWCPVQWDPYASHRCTCRYEYYPVIKFELRKNKVPFICTNTARSPVNNYYDDLDFVALSESERPRFNITALVVVSHQYTQSDPPPFVGVNSTSIGTKYLNTVYVQTCRYAPLTGVTLITTTEFVCPVAHATKRMRTHCVNVNAPSLHRTTHSVSVTVGHMSGLPYRWELPISGRPILFEPDATCVDYVSTGKCDTRYCEGTATYEDPSPTDTCIPELHCVKGLYCPVRDYYSDVYNGTGYFYAGEAPETSCTFTGHNDTVTLDTSESFEACVDVQDDVGIPWCVNVTVAPNNSTGACVDDVICLNVNSDCQNVTVCVKTFGCPLAPGCGNSTECELCYYRCAGWPDTSLCKIDGCYACGYFNVCSVRTVCASDAVASYPLCQNITVGCETNTVTKYASYVKPWYTCERDRLSVSCQGDMVPFQANMTSTMRLDYETTTTLEFVHTGDFCSFLCNDNQTNTEDCYKLISDGLDCDHYRELNPLISVGPAAARNWLCSHTSMHIIDLPKFPLAGPGNNGITITSGYTDQEMVRARACLTADGRWRGYDGYKSTDACVMLAPVKGENRTKIPTPKFYTPGECATLKAYMENTFTDRYRFALNARLQNPIVTTPTFMPWHDVPGYYLEILGGYVVVTPIYTRNIDPIVNTSKKTVPIKANYRYDVSEIDVMDLYQTYKEYLYTSAELSAIIGYENETYIRNALLSRDVAMEKRDTEIHSCKRAVTIPCQLRNCYIEPKIAEVCRRYNEQPVPTKCPGGTRPCNFPIKLSCSTYLAPYQVVPEHPEVEIDKFLGLSTITTREVPQQNITKEETKNGDNVRSLDLFTWAEANKGTALWDMVQGIKNLYSEIKVAKEIIDMAKKKKKIKGQTGLESDDDDDSGYGGFKYGPEEKEVLRKAIASGRAGSLFNVFASILRSLDIAACYAVPGSPPCYRLDAALVKSKGMLKRAVPSSSSPLSSRNEVKTREDGNDDEFRYMDIRERSKTISESFDKRYISVIPPLSSIGNDCYIPCGYDFYRLVSIACLWDATAHGGLAEDLLDLFVEVLNFTCDLIGLEDGRENLLPRGGNIFNITNIPFTARNATVWFYGQNIVIVQKIQKLFFRGVSKIFGFTINTTDPGEIALTWVVNRLGYNSTISLAEAAIKWASIINLEPYDGPVGALYWILFAIPDTSSLPVISLLPFVEVLPNLGSADCKKLNGSYTLFNFPVFSPTWLPYLPTWGATKLISILKFVKEHQHIVPSGLIADDGQCSNISSLGIPFTEDCPCSPIYYNCGDKYGMTSHLDMVVYAVTRWLPRIAENRWMKGAARALWLGPMIDKFAGINSNPERKTYDYCFVVLLYGWFWILAILPLYVAILLFIANMIVIFYKLSLSLSAAFSLFILGLTGTAIGGGMGGGYGGGGGGGGGIGGGFEEGELEEQIMSEQYRSGTGTESERQGETIGTENRYIGDMYQEGAPIYGPGTDGLTRRGRQRRRNTYITTDTQNENIGYSSDGYTSENTRDVVTRRRNRMRRQQQGRLLNRRRQQQPIVESTSTDRRIIYASEDTTTLDTLQ